MNKNSKTTAFTLAEVLITLGIIGVVAAVSLPTIITNLNERRNSERQANIAQKMTQAMEHMRALGKLTPYASTEDFVNELKNHLKITKICDKDHLTDCWPVDTVIGADGNEYTVANAKAGEQLNLETTTNNMGLILADGASIILNYDNTSKGYDVGDRIRSQNKDLPIGGGQEKSFPYTTSVTSAIDFVMDVNGPNKPNREKDKDGKQYDIRSFQSAKFAKIFPCDAVHGKAVGGISSASSIHSGNICLLVAGTTSYNNCKNSCTSNGLDIMTMDVAETRCRDVSGFGWWSWVDDGTANSSEATMVKGNSCNYSNAGSDSKQRHSISATNIACYCYANAR